MTVIVEIAAGLVLGVAIIAIVAAYREEVSLALMLLPGLAVTALGIVILYYLCGSWKNVALTMLGLGITGVILFLANSIDSDEKYGPSFRAIASTVAVAVAIVSFTSLAILAGNLMVSPLQAYLAILAAIVASAVFGRFFYRYALRKELRAASEKFD